MTTTEIITIILSLVALTVTIVGFFASLKFYRDGVELQRLANEALVELKEKTGFIQSQVGGMFDKTLDAAIGKREIMSISFAELGDHIDEARSRIVEESLQRIGTAGAEERQRLTQIVDQQIEYVRDEVAKTRKTLERVAASNTEPPVETVMSRIERMLDKEELGLTSTEIHSRLGVSDNSFVAAMYNLMMNSSIVRFDRDNLVLYKLNLKKERQ